MKIKTFITTLMLSFLVTGISGAMSDVEFIRNMALSTRHQTVTSVGCVIQSSQEEDLRTNEYGSYSGFANWIAVEPGTGTFTTNKFEMLMHPSIVNHNFQTFSFQNTFSTAPAYLASMQIHAGGDTASIRYRNLTSTSTAIMVQEENSADDEMAHDVAEPIGYIAAEPGNITAGGSIIGEIGKLNVTAAQRDIWHPITLNNTYTDPILVTMAISYNDSEPVTLVLNRTDNKFYIQLCEWEYQDKIHGQETISYIVVEAGEHVLDNGSALKAGITAAPLNNIEDPRNNIVTHWQAITFPTAFDVVPIIFSVPTMFMGYDLQAEVVGSSTLQEDENSTFMVIRDTDVGSSTIEYEIGGSAVNGTDYVTISDSITFANGQSSATVTITPIDNTLMNLERTINIYVPSMAREVSLDILLLDNELYDNEFIQKAGSVEVFCGENGYINLNNSSDRAELALNPASSGRIEITLYDMMGTFMWSATIDAEAGAKRIVYWSPNDTIGIPVVSGIYFFYINGAGINMKKKMAVIR